MRSLCVVAFLVLVGCDDGSSIDAHDLAVPRDLTTTPDLTVCVAGVMPGLCFPHPQCCAPCPQSGSYKPTDTCTVVGLTCEYENWAFACGSDHHYYCVNVDPYNG